MSYQSGAYIHDGIHDSFTETKIVEGGCKNDEI